MSELELENEAALDETDDSALMYPHVLRTVSERPWAILPGTLAVIVDLLSYRARGHRLTKAEVEERIQAGRAAAASRRGGASAGAVAVLPLFGVIAPRAAALNSVSGPSGTGVDAFTRMFRQALADPAVGSILIEVDSPGGRVDQVPELAAEIRGARGQKPIVAIANTTAASAAYWIASQCDEIVVTPSGEVGSIGVYCAHEDLSAALDADGVKVTLISAGKFKTEGNPFEPLSEEAQQAMQADVDAFYSMFAGDVAKGRGVTVDDVKNGFGQGRMVMARDAVKAGMADRVATFDDTVRRLASGAATAGRKADAGNTGIVSATAGNIYAVAVPQTADLVVTFSSPTAVAETENAAAVFSEDPEGGQPSNLEPVPGAERLLRYGAVREAFTPGPTN